jgi:hypothetical protein
MRPQWVESDVLALQLGVATGSIMDKEIGDGFWPGLVIKQ